MCAGMFGEYSTIDLLQVRVNVAGVVEYAQNDVVLYSSTVDPSYPLGVDTSFNNPSGWCPHSCVMISLVEEIDFM